MALATAETRNPAKVWGMRLGALVVAAVVAFVAQSAVTSWNTPSLDTDTDAYLKLFMACRSPKYSTMKAGVETAEAQTSDPDLRQAASMISEGCDVAINAGVDDVAEANSFSGGVKGFVEGFLNPLLSIDAARAMARQWWNSDVFQRIDDRYKPRIDNFLAAYQQAQSDGTWAFWIGGIAVAAFYYRWNTVRRRRQSRNEASPAGC